MADYAVARLEEIDEVDDGRCPFRPVRHHLGIMTFGVNAMTARADGDRLINEHDESEPESGEELYAVVSGRAQFEVDGETVDAPAGTFVRVAPGVTRTAYAETAGTCVLAIGAGPADRPYRPSGWELMAPLFPLFESGEYELGADRAAELLRNHPPSTNLLYNAACFESRAGRIDAALDHLRQAIELDPQLAELARGDDDFGPLRDEPRFGEIIEPAPGG